MLVRDNLPPDLQLKKYLLSYFILCFALIGTRTDKMVNMLFFLQQEDLTTSTINDLGIIFTSRFLVLVMTHFLCTSVLHTNTRGRSGEKCSTISSSFSPFLPSLDELMLNCAQTNLSGVHYLFSPLDSPCDVVCEVLISVRQGAPIDLKVFNTECSIVN